MNTPILLMVYIKPDTTIKIIERLKIIKTKIYISINTLFKKNSKDIIKNKKF